MHSLLENLRKRFTQLRESELGATAVEYGIMVALIAVVIIAAVWGIGQALREDFDCVENALEYSSEYSYTQCD